MSSSQSQGRAEDLSGSGELAGAELPPGFELGPYAIEGCIGRGAMACVYRARHRVLNKLLALKVIAPELMANAAARQRFLTEGRAAAAIVHPNVVWVADAGIVNGLPYLALELLEGENLEQH